MKLEVRIALVKELERAKNVLSKEYSARWTRYGYLGVSVLLLMGVSFLTGAIL